ncbi:ABC transporter permease [Pseudonocardia pini]|uniref:ABC transporter permease n=1 Tax=Pseudonocardia pini TaxID=2758030 RepID=UPI0015F04817|nr:ABC transporter permease [Pseudonocardia pini]
MSTAPAGPATTEGRIARLGYPVAGVASVVAVWALASGLGLVAPEALPGPLAVLAAIPQLLGDGEFLPELGDTLWTWLVSLVLTTVVAVPVGLAVGSVPAAQRATMVAVNAFRSVPSSALIPIGILIFGLGITMKVALAVYAIAWPILISTLYGVASTEPMRIDAGRSMRWPWWRRQVFVVLPSALPQIATGIRIAASVALVVVVSTELLGASTGAGVVLVSYQQGLRPDVVYAGVLLLAAMGAIVYALLAGLERRLFTWVPHV